MSEDAEPLVRELRDLGIGDVPSVGGKNASLGEMLRALAAEGIRVPDGFATTAAAFRMYMDSTGLTERIRALFDEMHSGARDLASTGREIRRLIAGESLPLAMIDAISASYQELERRTGINSPSVAVRSSATAEDLPEASFAGQHESYLNISGVDEVVDACHRCVESLFTDRAISYHEQHGFDHMKVALSVGVQLMVHSESGGAGVIFTLDPDTGFPGAVSISAGWGLGETVVKGVITPDEYTVFKPLLDHPSARPIINRVLGEKLLKMVAGVQGQPTQTVETTAEERSGFVLTDDEALQLARWAVRAERHYGVPMDLEWARDGQTGELFIVQSRPETVQSRRTSAGFQSFRLTEQGTSLVAGIAIGESIAAGAVRVVEGPQDFSEFRDGEILVTQKTDPDWVPVMRRAAGVVTDRGGRTSHAAIVSREFGLPAIVGCGDATSVLATGQDVTISCAQGSEGHVYDGKLAFEHQEVKLEDIPATHTRVMMNIATPAAAFRWWRLPVMGIGLARMEFIVNNSIKIHPMALVHFDRVTDAATREEIETVTAGYPDKTEFFVDKLAVAFAQIAASQYPHDVILRMSDFKTNEYAQLVGGQQFEMEEENPMLGFRGASRYYNPKYREGFALECRAVKRAQEEIGMHNLVVMVPFCRTPEEADLVLEEMADNGLQRGVDGLKVFVMAEIPSNVLMATEFANRFDGFSIGSNELTQMILGVDRDSAELRDLFDEQHIAVKRAISMLIRDAHAAGVPVGICGEAPSNHLEFTEFLVKEGIDSISLSLDSLLTVLRRIASTELAMNSQTSAHA